MIGRSCGNQAFKTGSNFPNRGASGTAGGTNYYSIAQPSATVPYIPVVGRNSLTGPCYRDIDFSLGKQVAFEGLGHAAVLRFQANVQSTNFGQSQAADAGRVIEFLARLQF